MVDETQQAFESTTESWKKDIRIAAVGPDSEPCDCVGGGRHCPKRRSANPSMGASIS